MLQDGKTGLELYEKITGQMETAFKLRHAFEGPFETFSQAFVNYAERLKEEESFFFQGGWTEKGLQGGHAIVYEVIKEKNGLYIPRAGGIDML